MSRAKVRIQSTPLGWHGVSISPRTHQVVMILKQNRAKWRFLSNKSGVRVETIRRWVHCVDSGIPCRPLGITQEFVMRYLGYENPWVQRD